MMFERKPQNPESLAGAFAGARAGKIGGPANAFMLPDGTRQAPAPPVLANSGSALILDALPPATGLSADWDDAVLG